MVSAAKKRARRDEAAEAEAEAAASGRPEADDDSDESDSDSDDEEAAPSKRKGLTPSSAAAARVGLTAQGKSAVAETSGRGDGAAAGGWRNKEKPLVLSSRGIPGR